jgi:hypothetical protein
MAQSSEEGRFDAIAEAILAKVPRRGVPMNLQQRRNGVTKPCSPDGNIKGCPEDPPSSQTAELVHAGWWYD